MENVLKKLFQSFRIIIILSVIIILNSCSEDESTEPQLDNVSNFSIAVFSDPHYFDPSLGTSGEAFQEYISKDRKLIAESEAILNSAVTMVKNSSAQIVIIPGDLTKDGELSSHQKFAQIISQLEAAGKKVFVIPGNHDVLNPESYSYSGTSKTKISSVSPQDFAQIYTEFGYKEAITKDPNSLSYVVEPLNGVRLIGMDGSRYNENGNEHSVTGGKYSTETFNWIKAQIKEAKSLGKVIIGFTHHGILEHFTGQKTNPISSEYVIDDFATVSAELAAEGLTMVFTGHFHANDITVQKFGDKFIFDVETGSLVTSPSPVRFLSFNENSVEVNTEYVSSINYDLGGKSYQQYANDFLLNGMNGIVNYTLVNQFGVPSEQANQLTPLMVAAFVFHYNGDETLPAEFQPTISAMMQSSDPNTVFFGLSLQSLFTDLPPADNDVVLDLTTGTFSK